MTATLPPEVQQTFQRFVTAELTTIDRHGRPITWPVTPFYRPGDPYISVTTGLGYPKKAHDALRNPKVALLFSDATGSDIERPSMVLVQGIAEVDDHDLAANRARYVRDLRTKPTGAPDPPREVPGGRFDWYFTRIYLHVRPERVYVWRDGDCGVGPELFGTSAGDQDDVPSPPPYGGKPTPDRRIGEIGSRYETAVLSLAGPDGFPLAVRLPMTADRRGRSIAIHVEPGGVTLRPGPVCVTAHDHDEHLRWTRNFQVRGDLVSDPGGGWSVVPHRMVNGFELPPGGALVRAVSNVPKIRRFRKTAKRERERRG